MWSFRALFVFSVAVSVTYSQSCESVIDGDLALWMRVNVGSFWHVSQFLQASSGCDMVFQKKFAASHR